MLISGLIGVIPAPNDEPEIARSETVNATSALYVPAGTVIVSPSSGSPPFAILIEPPPAPIVWLASEALVASVRLPLTAGVAGSAAGTSPCSRIGGTSELGSLMPFTSGAMASDAAGDPAAADPAAPELAAGAPDAGAPDPGVAADEPPQAATMSAATSAASGLLGRRDRRTSTVDVPPRACLGGHGADRGFNGRPGPDVRWATWLPSMSDPSICR